MTIGQRPYSPGGSHRGSSGRSVSRIVLPAQTTLAPVALPSTAHRLRLLSPPSQGTCSCFMMPRHGTAWQCRQSPRKSTCPFPGRNRNGACLSRPTNARRIEQPLAFHNAIVINEIRYDHIGVPAAPCPRFFATNLMCHHQSLEIQSTVAPISQQPGGMPATQHGLVASPAPRSTIQLHSSLSQNPSFAHSPMAGLSLVFPQPVCRQTAAGAVAAQSASIIDDARCFHLTGWKSIRLNMRMVRSIIRLLPSWLLPPPAYTGPFGSDQPTGYWGPTPRRGGASIYTMRWRGHCLLHRPPTPRPLTTPALPSRFRLNPGIELENRSLNAVDLNWLGITGGINVRRPFPTNKTLGCGGLPHFGR